MAAANKTVVVLGASGNVGQGIVHKFLAEGATVVAVSRSQDKLAALRKALAGSKLEHLHDVIGDFGSEAHATQTRDKVHAVLKGKHIDHVFSILGFFKQTAHGPTQTPIKEVREAFDETFYPNLAATHAFLPELKDREGATFTLASGGFAHMTPAPQFWLGTVKNAALNALNTSLGAEFKDAKVRTNTVCIHFGVAPIGGEKNQTGWPATDSRDLANAFYAVTVNQDKGKLICLNTGDEAKNYK